jgi:hypothetical protein
VICDELEYINDTMISVTVEGEQTINGSYLYPTTATYQCIQVGDNFFLRFAISPMHLMTANEVSSLSSKGYRTVTSARISCTKKSYWDGVQPNCTGMVSVF